MKSIVMRLEFIVAVFAIQTRAHNLGLHGLSGVNPSGDPILPEISGAFEVALNVRFIDFDNDKYSSILHWTTTNSQESIYIGYDDDSRKTKLAITKSGSTTNCYATENLDKETNYAFRVSVSSTGEAQIFIDNVQQGSCSNVHVPADVTRDKHLLGMSELDGDGDHVALRGHISGLRITNGGSAQHPSEAFMFWNFPGQSFDKGFVVSFYARFDNLAGGNYQAVFDFGNGLQSDNLWCGQYKTTDRFSCEIWVGVGGASTRHEFFANPGSIVEGEFAFWHIYGDANGSYWIEKDGAQSGVTADLELPNAVFRRKLLFGHDHWTTDDTMDGVVLGLRLDPLPLS